MDFKTQQPIYRQIADLVSDWIMEGRYVAEDRLPSVRDVAAELGVNPNTVARSFDQLTADGVVYNRRGVGYFVVADAKDKVLNARRKQFIDVELPLLKQRLQLLGLSLNQLIDA